MILRVFILFISMLVTMPASAIVSMESLHLGKPEPGWSGQFELGASGASGNTEKYDAATGARLQWHQNLNTSFLVLNVNYGRTAGVTNTDNRFAHLRHIRDMNEDVAMEGFMQLEQNRFIRLEYRDLAGIGLRLSLFNDEEQGAGFLGLGAFYVREKLFDPGIDEPGAEKTWRANVYLVLKYRIGDHSRIVNSTYYQPGLSETEDYRVLEELSLAVDINKSVVLKLGVNVRHDSMPPLGVEETDTTYRAGFVYRF